MASFWSRFKHRKDIEFFSNILAFLIISNITLYFLQPGMIFIPYGTMNQTPSDWKMDYEDVFLKAQNKEKIHGWYIPKEGAKATLLFFHGNAGNISHRGVSIEIFHEMGLNVFIIDYRGYGKSEGFPDEIHMYEDAMLAWEYLINKKDTSPDRIIIFGRSMGGAVATNLASKVEAGAHIADDDKLRVLLIHLDVLEL